MKKFLYLTSKAALVTREEITISSLVRISYLVRNYHFFPGDECAWQFHGKNDVQQIKVYKFVNDHRIYRLIQEYKFTSICFPKPLSLTCFKVKPKTYKLWTSVLAYDSLLENQYYRNVKKVAVISTGLIFCD